MISMPHTALLVLDVDLSMRALRVVERVNFAVHRMIRMIYSLQIRQLCSFIAMELSQNHLLLASTSSNPLVSFIDIYSHVDSSLNFVIWIGGMYQSFVKQRILRICATTYMNTMISYQARRLLLL